MAYKDIMEKAIAEAWDIYVPSLSIDCVVFGFHDNKLKVIVTKLLEQNVWALPGGFVLKNESLDTAANRILSERTGAKDIYLQQFKVFGELNRSEGFFADFDDTMWSKQRFISIGYFALVDFSKVKLSLDYISEACEWKSIDDLPEFMMDHRQILDQALISLRKNLNYKPVGYSLLPKKFTIPELQKLYETILNTKLNRGNFYRRILRYDILIKLDEVRKGGAHKAPDLYKFDLEKYKLALKNGLNQTW
jgi:8-oxo-dGTP diphosphatase